jgi:hypothetical protein
MPHAVLADLLVVLHLAFVVFVVAGGLLALRWPRVAWLHLPAAAWGAVVEVTGWLCPLTPLENHLRQRAGLEVYTGDFVGRYVVPVLYPEGLTPDVQLFLGVMVIALNATIYAAVIRRRSSKRRVQLP